MMPKEDIGAEVRSESDPKEDICGGVRSGRLSSADWRRLKPQQALDPERH